MFYFCLGLVITAVTTILPGDKDWVWIRLRIVLGVCVQLMELKLTVDGLEKERDFYFSKLRDIELICQENESETNTTLSKIIDILYATEVGYI